MFKISLLQAFNHFQAIKNGRSTKFYIFTFPPNGELICIITAHTPKSYHLGLGKSVIIRGNLAKADANRDSKIFEEFAYKMISIAQKNGHVQLCFNL
jgi:hypothetical protein